MQWWTTGLQQAYHVNTITETEAHKHNHNHHDHENYNDIHCVTIITWQLLLLSCIAHAYHRMGHMDRACEVWRTAIQAIHKERQEQQ